MLATSYICIYTLYRNEQSSPVQQRFDYGNQAGALGTALYSLQWMVHFEAVGIPQYMTHNPYMPWVRVGACLHCA